MSGLEAAVQQLVGLAVGHAGVIFLRVAALVTVMPAFGERTVPVRIKLVVAMMMTAIVAPAVPPTPGFTTAGAAVHLIASETVTGLALGLAVRLFVLALQTAGSIAAQSTSLAQILGGAAAEPIPAMGYVLVVAGLALAVMNGLHVEAARLLIRSYDLFPAGRFGEAGPMAGWGVARVSQAFALAFTLAAPFVIASVIYNLALGVINRAMPQLMVAFVGAPALVAALNWLGRPLIDACVIQELNVRQLDFTIRAILALAVGYSAFISEIFRAGIQSVERGQTEAALALGMSNAQAMRRIILPQAVRNVLPPLGNEFVAMLKDSALVSVLGVQDITQLGKVYSASTFKFFQTYNTVAFLYLVMTIGLSLAVGALERRLRQHQRQ